MLFNAASYLQHEVVSVPLCSRERREVFYKVHQLERKHPQVGIIKHVLHINAISNSVQDLPQILDE